MLALVLIFMLITVLRLNLKKKIASTGDEGKKTVKIMIPMK